MTNIEKELIKFGVQPQNRGFDYLAYAIELVMKDTSYRFQITKRLYPDVAKKFNTTASRAVRCIRHAVETSLNNIDPDTLFELYKNTLNFDGTVTNSQFISTVYLNLK